MDLKKTFSLLLAAALLLCFSGCGYTSRYRAVGCVRTNTASHASIRFSELEGTVVFKMKLKDAAESDIRYTVSLQEGSVKVYYDYSGEKIALFEMNGGNNLESAAGYVEKGPFTVIVETDGKAVNGALDFSVE